MITISQSEHLLTVVVLGEFTLADFKEFEESVLYKTRFEGAIDLVFDLREMAAFTVDMAWEEIKFSRQHGADFKKIAVITDSQWVTWSAWLEQLFVSADLRVFTDPADARFWLDGETP